uniref:CTNNB1 binding N-teminal domain-containing protein n=1 Tax=Mesocestoides corti TaxID=53468 RepID=A0A5K3G054_MESCO
MAALFITVERQLTIDSVEVKGHRQVEEEEEEEAYPIPTYSHSHGRLRPKDLHVSSVIFPRAPTHILTPLLTTHHEPPTYLPTHSATTPTYLPTYLSTNLHPPLFKTHYSSNSTYNNNNNNNITNHH